MGRGAEARRGRYRDNVSRIYFRADVGFANPNVYEFLERERLIEKLHQIAVIRCVIQPPFAILEDRHAMEVSFLASSGRSRQASSNCV
jgi:hypothetical protein